MNLVRLLPLLWQSLLYLAAVASCFLSLSLSLTHSLSLPLPPPGPPIVRLL